MQNNSSFDMVPAEQQLFSQMITDHPSLRVEVVGTDEGFVVTFRTPNGREYVLHTQRKNVRRFKSASTLFNFLAEIGVSNVVVKNLDLCATDTYVRKNSVRHQKRLQASHQ